MPGTKEMPTPTPCGQAAYNTQQYGYGCTDSPPQTTPPKAPATKDQPPQPIGWESCAHAAPSAAHDHVAEHAHKGCIAQPKRKKNSVPQEKPVQSPSITEHIDAYIAAFCEPFEPTVMTACIKQAQVCLSDVQDKITYNEKEQALEVPATHEAVNLCLGNIKYAQFNYNNQTRAL